MTAHARIVKAQPITVATLARQMLTEANGDHPKAAAKLIGYVSNFPALAEEILLIGARKLISEVPQIERKAMESERSDTGASSFVKAPHRMTAGAKAAQARLRAAGSHIRNSLLMFPFTIGGLTKPLSDWLGVEVMAHGETQLLAGTTQVRNARYLIAVGRAAGHKKIGYALKDEQVEKLYSEAMDTAV